MSRGGAHSTGGSEGQDVTQQRFHLLPQLLVFNTYSSFYHVFMHLLMCVYFYPPTYFYMTVLESGCIFERDSSSIQKLFAFRASDSLTTSATSAIIWVGWSTNLGFYTHQSSEFLILCSKDQAANPIHQEAPQQLWICSLSWLLLSQRHCDTVFKLKHIWHKALCYMRVENALTSDAVSM